MDLTGLYPFLAVLCSIFGLFVGAWAKRRTQVVIPFNEPVSWLLVMLIFLILLMPDINPDWAFIDPYDIGQDACIIGFYIMYMYGYWKEEILAEFVSAHDVWRLRQDIMPITYSYDDDGSMYWQPQKMRYVLKRLLFDVKCPLYTDLGNISRRREVTFQGKYIKLNARVVDTAKMDISEEWVQKGPFKFKVLGLRFDPSPLNTYDAYDFYCQGKIADDYLKNYEKVKMDNLMAAADIRTAKMNGSYDLVAAITDMRPEKQILDRIVGDLDARNNRASDVKRHDRETADSPEQKDRERRRRMSREERAEGDGDA